jgi:ERCC4-type nuclease
VLVTGAAVVHTRDHKDSAAWLIQLHRLEGKGPSQARGRPRTRRATEDAAQVAEDVLGCLPGVSTVGARRLLRHFGSLAAVFAADEAELRAVTGIGPIRAAQLARVFRAEPG